MLTSTIAASGAVTAMTEIVTATATQKWVMSVSLLVVRLVGGMAGTAACRQVLVLYSPSLSV
jgi:hypothetical protein